MDKHSEDDLLQVELSALKESLQPLDSQLKIPDSMKPENIVLTDSKVVTPAPTRRSFRPKRTLIVAIACLVMLAPTYLIGKELFQKKSNGSEVASISGYAELRSLYKDLASANRHRVVEEATDSAAPNLSATQVQGSATSTTNVQVEGVDEADIVKTDGNYIYSIYNTSKPLSKYDKVTNKQMIQITSTLRTGEMKTIQKIELPANEQINEMYIKDSKLVVISIPEQRFLERSSGKIISQQEYSKLQQNHFSNNQANRREDNFFEQYKAIVQTTARLYDVTEPTNPKIVREFSQEGNYLSSRLIEDDLYLVTNQYSYQDYEDKAVSDQDIVPFTKDSVTGDEMTLVDPDSICIVPNPSAYSFVIVSGFNISNLKEAKTEAVLGAGHTVYASKNALYLFSEDYGDQNKTFSNKVGSSPSAKNRILKYSLDNGVPKLASEGQVPGQVLNQFSVDEHEGNLRIATTTYQYNKGSVNNIYVLDNQLKQIGAIEGLAPGEHIESVRFMGEKGYVVTFKQVDPLFALDLSNPTQPKVTGQLKIPGFSEYLHPYSENLLIGLGHNTIDRKNGMARLAELKLSLFDVSDANNPREIQAMPLDGFYSEALNNHKAVLFSKEKNLIAFPMDNQYVIYTINPDSGFTLAHSFKDSTSNAPYKEEMMYYMGGSRGVYVDDVFYIVSSYSIKAYSLTDYHALGQIELK